MESIFQTIQKEATTALQNVENFQHLEDFRVEFLGKKGRIASIGKNMSTLSKEEKPLFGKMLNQTQKAIQEQFQRTQVQLQQQIDQQTIQQIDPTLPAYPFPQGTLHPISQVKDRAIRILRTLGFCLEQGPEIEHEFYCFDALNTPADHPARNPQDTFYLDEEGTILRTHTSSVQIRSMEKTKELPLRIIAPGSAFRRDEIDATHLPVFNQLEGLYVAPKVSIQELHGCLKAFFSEFFEQDIAIRFRPHFFPFTEPSFEIDLQFTSKKKQQQQWIEIAGCGMVDPAVFAAVNKQRKDDLFATEQVQGYAFGVGLDRLAMVLWQIKDIRHLVENDVRFLKQFK